VNYFGRAIKTKQKKNYRIENKKNLEGAITSFWEEKCGYTEYNDNLTI
jgi:hypothetical protein